MWMSAWGPSPLRDFQSMTKIQTLLLQFNLTTTWCLWAPSKSRVKVHILPGVCLSCPLLTHFPSPETFLSKSPPLPTHLMPHWAVYSVLMRQGLGCTISGFCLACCSLGSCYSAGSAPGLQQAGKAPEEAWHERHGCNRVWDL